jgi:hypothetical protein
MLHDFLLARGILHKISEELESGQARLTLLGTSGQSMLSLDAPDAMARYAALIRPDIHQALRQNRRLEWITVSCLLLLFVITTTLSVLVQTQSWGWRTSMATVPGLGVTAYMPVRLLLRIRRENTILAILPTLVPLLSRKELLGLLNKLLSGEPAGR